MGKKYAKGDIRALSRWNAETQYRPGTQEYNTAKATYDFLGKSAYKRNKGNFQRLGRVLYPKKPFERSMNLRHVKRLAEVDAIQPLIQVRKGGKLGVVLAKYDLLDMGKKSIDARAENKYNTQTYMKSVDAENKAYRGLLRMRHRAMTAPARAAKNAARYAARKAQKQANAMILQNLVAPNSAPAVRARSRLSSIASLQSVARKSRKRRASQ